MAIETSPLPGIRAATPEDAKAIASVHVAAWRESYAGLLPEAMLAGLSVDDRARRWSRILETGKAAVFVAEADGAVHGFASGGAQRDNTLFAQGFTGEISAIYLLRCAQGKGAGRALMAAVAQALAARDHRAASLWVLRDNHAARGFYQKLGGVVVGEKQDRRDGVTLIETAYGWRDLSHLAGR